MGNYRTKKGEEGETFVEKLLIPILDKMDYKYEYLRNTYLPFASVYGLKGHITAEFDFIIFTPFLVYLIEVKNGRYSECDCEERLWKLMDGSTTSNPIIQNRNHKNVFCSEMNFPRDRVITVEILLEYSSFQTTNIFPNDYVFGTERLEENLFYLLSTETGDNLDYEELHDRFIEIVSKYPINKDIHTHNIEITEKVETRIRNVFGYIPLHRTDIVKCNSCKSGNLVLREMPYKTNPFGKHNSMHYALGCSNYGSKSVECNLGLIYLDKNKDKNPFKSIIPIHIEEKNNWGVEKVNSTVLDKFNQLENQIKELKEQNRALEDQVKILNYKNDQAVNMINEKNEECEELRKKVEQSENNAEMVNKELDCFNRLFGKIYFYNKK